MSNESTNEKVLSLSSGTINFIFRDEDDGKEFASFRLNPADVRLADRLNSAANYFAEISNKGASYTSLDSLAALDSEIADKMCDVLGYDVHESLFGQLSPMTMLPTGELFITYVLNAITDVVKPAISARRKKAEKLASKYSGKYNA